MGYFFSTVFFFVVWKPIASQTFIQTSFQVMGFETGAPNENIV